MEIITSQNSGDPTSILLIYENRGDNAFALAFSDTIPDSGPLRDKAIADLDGDGLTEIAFAGAYGRVYVYESSANDIWTRVWSSDTGTHNAYAVCVGSDADGNGKPELFVMGSRDFWSTIIYEASCNNTFVRTATITINDGYVGQPHNAVVDLDNIGKQEYVMSTNAGLWIYRAAAPGQWHLVGQTADPPPYYHFGVFAFDLNHNGRQELIWTGYPTTLILEDRAGSTGVGEPTSPKDGSLAAFPNPCRSRAEIRVAGPMQEAARLGIYDVSVRLVERYPLLRDAAGGILWPTQHLRCGVYLLRLENSSGRTLAAGRGVVAR